jgi:hypothetical protein
VRRFTNLVVGFFCIDSLYGDVMGGVAECTDTFQMGFVMIPITTNTMQDKIDGVTLAMVG